MTQPTPNRRERLMTAALELAAAGVPVLPLRAGKLPFGNCPACRGNVCGGRPNMKTAGACVCPAPCHGWAAATIDPNVLNSTSWRRAWWEARAVAYHPGGAGLTVVDLDNAEAIAWARASLPATRTVPTTRGEHWLYRGAMQGANNVRPGVDIKSTMAYARWLGPGTGPMAPLPDVVRALTVKKPAPARSVAVTVPAMVGGGECPHRTPTYLDRGIAMAEQRITEAREAVHATVYRVFLAVLSTHGRCGCLTETHTARLFIAAQAKGESPRHCTDAWTNAMTTLGLGHV
ncbi:bifunctional DNA primase/polymerase [Streptomyces sp. NP-1717]|uniref:bifunctional DNA primase/polymerase n=1 Tax=Streptomyces sp. NP-1717 TaxID=2704470 RepID=UPI001F5CCE47|nr:bifunctional DNA primase/polymerase [Streptomyces sp. NP-1717]MCI3225949.1 bifunctional DNA primase/polymerase [Streptomyces sp. NP-1717]